MSLNLPEYGNREQVVEAVRKQEAVIKAADALTDVERAKLGQGFLRTEPPIPPSFVIIDWAAVTKAFPICGLNGSVVLPMPRLMIFASGFSSMSLFFLRFISGNRYPPESRARFAFRHTIISPVLQFNRISAY